MKTHPSLTVFGLLAALVSAEGCSKAGPTAPGLRERPTGPTFTVSGVITEYRGAPLAGVDVVWGECNLYWGIPCSTKTDQQGRYSLSSLSGTVNIATWKDGYQTAWKRNLSMQNPSADLALHPSVTLNPHDAALAATIRGDEMMAGDDVLFGGLCDRSACKIIALSEFTGPNILVEVRLRWSDPTRQLALYHWRGDPESIPGVQPVAERYCCSSELVAILSVSGYFDAVAVAFEQAGDGPPGPADSQSFELTARAIR